MRKILTKIGTALLFLEGIRLLDLISPPKITPTSITITVGIGVAFLFSAMMLPEEN